MERYTGSVANLDQYPDQGRVHELLSRFMEEGMDSEGWHRPAADCPSFQWMLRRPRSQQRDVLLGMLVRMLWQLECRGREAVARLFLLYDAAKLMLSRKLPWDGERLTALGVLTTHPNIVQELGALVVRQVDWHEDTPEPVRRALKRLKRVGRLHGQIDSVLSRETHSPPTSTPLKERQMRALVGHSRRVPDQISRRWWRKGVALLKDLGTEEIDRHLAPWLEKRLSTLHRDHPRLLKGLVVLLGGVATDRVASCLQAVVLWGYRRRQGYGFLDRSIAHSAIRALGRLGTSLSVAYLVCLGSELRYPDATHELLATLRKLADRRGGSLHDLVEVETAAHQPGSRLGKRLRRSHIRRLERCLRTGRQWELAEWTESYQDSPLLGALGRELIWENSVTSFRWTGDAWRDVQGRIVTPKGPLWLWHPAETRVSWSVRPSPFPQVDREIFAEVDFEPCLVRQYQFAALASARDWYYRSVGRFRESSRAEIRLAGCQAWIEVERAAGNGPFSKEGLSIQVRLTELGGDRPLATLPARIRSEIIRDVHLFTTVALVRNAKAH